LLAYIFCTAHDLLLLVYLKLGGGGSAGGVHEPLTQPSPAKPTWAQILNSNPNTSSSTATTTGGNNNNNNNAAAGNNSPSSSSPSSQHSATTKTISPSASGTLNVTGSRPGFMPNFYDQQQSQMNWSLNFNQTSSWMINDNDSQRQPTNSSQQSIDNTQIGGGDGMRVFILLSYALKKKFFFFFFNKLFFFFEALIDLNHRVQHLIGISR
jgi:hypothetical protein